MIFHTPRQNQARLSNEGYKGLFLELEYPNPEFVPDDPIIGGGVEDIPETVTLRYWSGLGTVNDDEGNEWLGLGDMLSFSGMQMAERLKVDKISFALNGADQETVAAQAGVKVQGNRGTLYDGYIDENHRIIDNLIVRFSFTMDNIENDVATDENLLILNAHAGMADFTPTQLLWSHAAQQARLQGDQFQEPIFPGVSQVPSDSGFTEMSRIATEGADVVWITGQYEGLDNKRVQFNTSLSGTRNNENTVRDFIIP